MPYIENWSKEWPRNSILFSHGIGRSINWREKKLNYGWRKWAQSKARTHNKLIGVSRKRLVHKKQYLEYLKWVFDVLYPTPFLSALNPYFNVAGYLHQKNYHRQSSSPLGEDKWTLSSLLNFLLALSNCTSCSIDMKEPQFLCYSGSLGRKKHQAMHW